MSFKPNFRKIVQLNQQILSQIKTRNFSSKIKEQNWNELPKCQTPKCDVPRLDDAQIKEEKPITIQENWNECNKPEEPKKFSCDDHPVEKPTQRRPRKSVPDKTSACTSKPQPPKKLEVEDCLKLKLDNCAEVNSSTKCMSYRPFVDCKKILAPKPSFSECQKDKIVDNKKTECKEKELK